MDEVKLNLIALTPHIDPDQFFLVLENLSDKVSDLDLDLATFFHLSEPLKLLNKASDKELVLDANVSLGELINEL